MDSGELYRDADRDLQYDLHDAPLDQKDEEEFAHESSELLALAVRGTLAAYSDETSGFLDAVRESDILQLCLCVSRMAQAAR